ncbi:MAG: hypothetical protein U1E08_04620 [Coriobacteriia bacterium]|nr:hypothetical protein [Coriobacteriia bacterium]
MYQESEIVDLLMVLFLTPIMAVSVRAIHVVGKRRFIAGYLAIASGYVFTIAEGYVAPVLFNTLEHLAYAVGGVCFLAGLVALAHASRVRAESP